MPYGNRTPYFKKCPVCKNQFKLAYWELKRKKTCSFKCSKEFKKHIPIKAKTLLKISKKLKGKYLREKSSQWKGVKATYSSQHEWINKEYIRIYGSIPKKCQMCNEEKKLHASNINHKYKREITEYQWLCAKCHAKYDKKDSNHFKKIGKLSKKTK